MTILQADARVTLNNILYLTDFSQPSEAALPFGLAVAREYGATLHAFHVLTPTTLAYTSPELAASTMDAQEDQAEANMQRLESQLDGVPHDTTVKRGYDVWPAVEDAILKQKADLIVLGTHGRTGAQKLVMGSVAEEIFRRSPVPVLTIGPSVTRGLHNSAHFHHILFATDLTPDSLAAAPWAFSMAQENQADLILLNIIHQHEWAASEKLAEETTAQAIDQLQSIVPPGAEAWCRPQTFVQYGDPARKILEMARERAADLIVLGVREANGYLGATTHFSRTTAQNVVAHARCPVLTVRGQSVSVSCAAARRTAVIGLTPELVV
jgi:nucleotide-binding universal stress UspA family protein